MSKVELNNLVSGNSVSLINDNFNKIETELNEKVLYRDNLTGEPNQMKVDLDMNNKRIYNLPKPVNDNEPVRLKDLVGVTGGGSVFVNAEDVTFTPDGPTESVNVQDAIVEVRDDLQTQINSLEIGEGTSIGWVSAFDFMSEAQITSVQARDLVQDVTVALQSALDACVSDNQNGVKTLWIPPGRYKITNSLSINKQYVVIKGAGKYATEINLAGAHSCFTTAVMTYLRPYITDLSINGGVSSNYGIYLGNITSQCYLGEFSRLLIYTGNSCIYAKGVGSNSNYFSMLMEDVDCYSYGGHSFHIRVGPGCVFKKLYALRCGEGKAGFRMAGMITLDGCNGLNQGDFWGVFGNDPLASDGFQSDFEGNDYPDVVLNMCNIEEWSSYTNGGSGIVFHNSIRSFVMNGGKFDRSRAALIATIPNCHSIVRARKASNNNLNPIELRPGSVFMGTTGYTEAPLYSDTGGVFSDPIGTFTTVGITTFKQGALTYPLPVKKLSNDRFNNYSFYESSLETRHHTVNVQRFKELSLADTGSNLALNVTGHTRVNLTAASPSSVSRLFFLITPGVISEDYLRNGELIVEATTANVTLNHNQAGSGKLILAGAVNRVLSSGEIVRFIWRSSDSAWVESGGAGSSIPISYTNTNLSSLVIDTPASVASVFFTPSSHWSQRVGNMVTGFGTFDFRAQGSAGADATWSVVIPGSTGWEAAWADLVVGLWSSQDATIQGHIAKKVGDTDRIVFACSTTAAVIAATKTCRFNYSYVVF